jgi:hypothetical protein
MCCNNHQNPVGPCYAMYSSISGNKFVRCYIKMSTVLLYTAMYCYILPCTAMYCHVLSLGQESSTTAPVVIQLYLTHTSKS